MAELYVKYRGDAPVAYAYGDPWVAQALFMDDLGYASPEEAQAAWLSGYTDKAMGKETQA
jgi:hypothetical protein